MVVGSACIKIIQYVYAYVISHLYGSRVITISDAIVLLRLTIDTFQHKINIFYRKRDGTKPSF